MIHLRKRMGGRGDEAKGAAGDGADGSIPAQAQRSERLPRRPGGRRHQCRYNFSGASGLAREFIARDPHPKAVAATLVPPAA
jgi:hypothetical protein